MNNLNFTGHITWIGPLEHGVNPNTGKEWSSRDFRITETSGDYQQSIVLRAKGEQPLAALEALRSTDFPEEVAMRAFITATTRFWEPKAAFFNNLTCWKLENMEGGLQ